MESVQREQEAFEKCWAHSPQWVASRQFTRCHAPTAHHVHDNDDDDNAWQRGPLWPHGMGPIISDSIQAVKIHQFLT